MDPVMADNKPTLELNGEPIPPRHPNCRCVEAAVSNRMLQSAEEHEITVQYDWDSLMLAVCQNRRIRRAQEQQKLLKAHVLLESHIRRLEGWVAKGRPRNDTG